MQSGNYRRVVTATLLLITLLTLASASTTALWIHTRSRLAEAIDRQHALNATLDRQTTEQELIVLKGGCCSGAVSCGDLIVEAGGVINATVACAKPEKVKESPVSTAAPTPSEKDKTGKTPRDRIHPVNGISK